MRILFRILIFAPTSLSPIYLAESPWDINLDDKQSKLMCSQSSSGQEHLAQRDGTESFSGLTELSVYKGCRAGAPPPCFASNSLDLELKKALLRGSFCLIVQVR